MTLLHEHDGAMKQPVLHHHDQVALRVAIAGHDVVDNSLCLCGARFDPHDSDGREEHLLEVAFAAGINTAMQEL